MRANRRPSYGRAGPPDPAPCYGTGRETLRLHSGQAFRVIRLLSNRAFVMGTTTASTPLRVLHCEYSRWQDRLSVSGDVPSPWHYGDKKHRWGIGFLRLRSGQAISGHGERNIHPQHHGRGRAQPPAQQLVLDLRLV